MPSAFMAALISTRCLGACDSTADDERIMRSIFPCT